jgi:Protein of unknown function (DUF1573)
MNKYLISFSLLFIAGCSTADERTKSKPNLYIPVKDVNLSTIRFDSSCHISYQLVNTGDAILKIDTATASCGCTIPVMMKKEINPADTGLLVVEYNPVDTGNFNKKVVIKSNIDSSFSIVSFYGTVQK